MRRQLQVVSEAVVPCGGCYVQSHVDELRLFAEADKSKHERQQKRFPLMKMGDFAVRSYNARMAALEQFQAAVCMGRTVRCVEYETGIERDGFSTTKRIMEQEIICGNPAAVELQLVGLDVGRIERPSQYEF